jgi:Icc-related predicted phosphoesterase
LKINHHPRFFKDHKQINLSEAKMASVSTRFLVISDTHNFEFDNASGTFSLPLPKVDVVLHCGDLTNIGGSSSFKNVLKMLGPIDAEKKLVIAGNHDLDLDKEHWRNSLQEGDDPEEVEKEHIEEHDTAVSIMTGPLAPAAGVTYPLEEGICTFTLKSGAIFTVYASPYQPEFKNWAFGYERGEDRFNSSEQVAEGVKSIAQNPVPDFPGVDIMMTHGPPKGILDECEQGSMGCENLLRAAGRARPRLYCFGHIHEGYGAKLINWESGEDALTNSYPESISVPASFGEKTLMVNAAIRDGENEAVNAPWLIDLVLPCTLS